MRHAEAILARLAEAEAELEAIAGLRGGRLRLAAFESAGATLMPLAIAAFRAEHPAVELSMIMSEPEDSVPLLRSGELDLALGFDSPHPRRGDGIDRHHLLEDPMFLALPRDHPLARKRNLRLADLADEAWIAGTPDCECNRLITRACAVAGLRAADRLRDRRLHGDAGLRRRRRRRLADRRARPDDRPRRHRRALARPRDAGARRSTPPRCAEGYRSPATQAMLEILRDVASRYESRRPQLELVG